jgi:four helix bundle protein
MSFKDLDLYKNSIDLVECIYRITKYFPDSEKFGLINQMRRASVSVSANFCEGYGREYPKDLIRFLYISMGSLKELEVLFSISNRLDYIKEEDYLKIKRQLHLLTAQLSGLIRSIKRKL